MAMRLHTKNLAKRLLKYIVIIAFISFVYVFWPYQQIEKLSDSLTLDEKNDYLDSILNPPKNEIYDGNSDPLKADFNPNNDKFDFSSKIDIEKMNKALNKMKMKPLTNDKGSTIGKESDSDFESQVIEKVNVIPDILSKQTFLTSDPLSGFLGSFDINKNVKPSCGKILYKPTDDEKLINYSEKELLLEDDLIEMRKWLLNSKFAEIVKTVDPHSADGTSLSDISHWFKSFSSSVWLPEEQLHMVASTIVYAPNDENVPLVSFLRLQLFNNEWKEIKGRRIRYSGLTDKDIDSALREYAKSNEERHLERISLRFPSILNIPILGDVKPKQGKTIGPTKPYLIYKDGEYRSEPVIVFDMDNNGVSKKYIVLPLNKPVGSDLEHPPLRFKGLTTLENDAWVPFFDSVRIGDSKTSQGDIHFINYNLLSVFKCSLDSGRCSKIQQQNPTKKDQSLNSIKGGSSLFPLPRQIVQSLTDGEKNHRLQIWAGMPTIETSNGLQSILMVLIKDDGVFRIELLSSPLEINDFVSDISYWDIASSGGGNNFNDHMLVTKITEDGRVNIVTLQNIVNYILGAIAPDGKLPAQTYNQELSYDRTRLVFQCANEISKSSSSFKNDDDVNNFKDKTTEEW
ncbi:hypothetical protein DAPK24_017170 [Pichia kluyveri]|uniref:Beta-mannosyltransferase 1 n=1 Tax=Pichia kluyveri TaxID=36015 RepID=A0AAV5R2C3_PICKL|nr:hypothetical protein DAPK24_017170 [Pichia kluyveri]